MLAYLAKAYPPPSAMMGTFRVVTVDGIVIHDVRLLKYRDSEGRYLLKMPPRINPPPGSSERDAAHPRDREARGAMYAVIIRVWDDFVRERPKYRRE